MSYFKVILSFELPDPISIESEEVEDFYYSEHGLDVKLRFKTRKVQNSLDEFEVYGGSIQVEPHSEELLRHPHKWIWEIWPNQSGLFGEPRLYFGPPPLSHDSQLLPLHTILIQTIERHVKWLSKLALRPEIHDSLWSGYQKMWEVRDDSVGGFQEIYFEDDNGLKESINLDNKQHLWGGKYGYCRALSNRRSEPLPTKRIKYLRHFLKNSSPPYWEMFMIAVEAADESEVVPRPGFVWTKQVRLCVSSLQTALETAFEVTQLSPTKSYNYNDVFKNFPIQSLGDRLHELHLTRNLVLHQGKNEFKKHISGENSKSRRSRGGTRELTSKDLLAFLDTAFEGICWLEDHPSFPAFQ